MLPINMKFCCNIKLYKNYLLQTSLFASFGGILMYISYTNEIQLRKIRFTGNHSLHQEHANIYLYFRLSLPLTCLIRFILSCAEGNKYSTT